MGIVWTEEAIDSFEVAYEALARRFPRLASQFADKVFECVQRISEFPESGPMVPEHENPRSVRCGSGQIACSTRISADGITIEGFLHMSVRLEIKE